MALNLPPTLTLPLDLTLYEIFCQLRWGVFLKSGRSMTAPLAGVRHM